jgi:uncharacterized protein YndB with AHSA1/START domain
MNVPSAGDAATVSVFVKVALADAFDVFTQEIDLWWRKGPKFRIAGQRRGSLTLEPKLNGRLFETFDHPKGSLTFQTGTVTHWDPPHALSFEWRGVNFKPGEKTLVEVRFTSEGEGTMVKLRHSGLSSLPAGHPARHGLDGAAFSRSMGLWWGELLTSLREHVADRREAGSDGEP